MWQKLWQIVVDGASPDSPNPLFLRAGEGIRTLDVHLGKGPEVAQVREISGSEDGGNRAFCSALFGTRSEKWCEGSIKYRCPTLRFLLWPLVVDLRSPFDWGLPNSRICVVNDRVTPRKDLKRAANPFQKIELRGPRGAERLEPCRKDKV